MSKSTIINECQKEPEESYLFKYQYILHIRCENNELFLREREQHLENDMQMKLSQLLHPCH